MMAQSSMAVCLWALGALLCGAMSESMPTRAPAPTSRQLLSTRAATAFNQMAQQKNEAEECSCENCHGVVGRPPAEGGDHDTVSLLKCRSENAEGNCGDTFCENSCKVKVSSAPDAKPRCGRKDEKEGLSLAQLREVTRLRSSCPPPQACTCACNCPEIVWPPLLAPPFGVPTPQPFFGGGALIQESAETHTTAPTVATSLLEVGDVSNERKSISAAAAAQAALQKSAVQDTIIKQTTAFVHHEDESFEARQRRHRRWLNGGGNSNPKAGLVQVERVADKLVEVDYAFHQPAQGRMYDVEPRRPVAAALQTSMAASMSAVTASMSALKGNPAPYNMLPPPPGPPPKGPPMRHDFRVGNVCPAHAPCNCYCHCKAPPGSSYVNFKPSHPQPIFTDGYEKTGYPWSH